MKDHELLAYMDESSLSSPDFIYLVASQLQKRGHGLDFEHLTNLKTFNQYDWLTHS